MNDRFQSLHQHHAVHPHPERVKDEAFVGGHPFFDARDLVQVKYEMLRRVHYEDQAVSRTVATFGFSRPTFYAAQAAFLDGGLPALLPQRPGPRRAHKLTDEVMAFARAARQDDPSLSAPALAELIRHRFGFEVHPRSLERRLGRQQKKRRGGGP